jgi:hypothetical protein
MYKGKIILGILCQGGIHQAWYFNMSVSAGLWETKTNINIIAYELKK